MQVCDQQKSNILTHRDFRHVYDFNPSSVIAIDDKGIIIYANPITLTSFSLSKTELEGKHLSLFFKDAAGHETSFAKLLSGFSINDVELMMIGTEKKDRLVCVNSVVCHDALNEANSYLFITDISIQKKKEEFFAFLNTAAEELAQTRDTESALKKISRLVVPKFANWFTIEILKDNKIELLVLEHEDPEKIKWAYEFRETFPTDMEADNGTAMVLKTGKASFFPVITNEMISASLTNPEQIKALRKLDLQSSITVAITNKKTITGAITFLSTTKGYHFTETDLHLAQNFANHVGLALENARLNEEAAQEIFYRKQIEERLKITQRQLQTALSSGLVGTWVRDLEKDLLYPDESLSQMFGIPHCTEGCSPKVFTDLIHSGDNNNAELKRTEAIEAGSIYETEYQVLIGKTPKWFFSRGKIDIDSSNKPILFTGVVIDITGRKNAEIALKESEERYSATFQNANIGILLGGIDGKFIKANPAYTALTGYTEDDLIGQDFRSFTHPDDMQRTNELYAQLFSNKVHKYSIEKRYICKNGSVIWVRISKSLVRNGEGLPYYTISILEDITEQKRAQANLKKSEELFRVLAESMPQKVFSTSSSGSITYLNPQWETFTGMLLEEVYQLTLAHFIHPEDLEANLKHWQAALASGKNFTYEHRFRNKDGEYIWHLTRALPQKDDQGNIINWIGTITDIHNQKENEKHKDEFISIASHELKTPLTSIKAFNQLMQRTKDEGKLQRFIKTSAEHILRLERLINDLLDVTKINAGKIIYTKEPFNFNEMLIASIESVQYSWPTHQIVLENSVDIDYTGDRFRIEQVVNNFLTNAVKYSPEAKKVIVNSKIEADNLVVSVQDFGIGIVENDLHRLFERYYRVDNTAMRFDGLGLGLFICSEILKRHDGGFWIESKPGQGSTFYFRLPLKVSDVMGPVREQNRFYQDSKITITFNEKYKRLDADWTGFQNQESVQNSCLAIVDMLIKNNLEKIVNDNTHTLGACSEAADWLASEWFPMLEKAGLKYFAWVFSPNAFSRLTARKSLDNAEGKVNTQFFADVASAEDWINSL